MKVDTSGFQTLDTIICKGESISSKVIAAFNRFKGVKGEAADVTHVAKILRRYGRIYVFESTIGNDWTDKTGVQINLFDEWIKHYKGEVYIRQNRFGESSMQGSGLEKAANRFADEMFGIRYESGIEGIKQLLATINRSHTEKNEANIHCNENNIILDQKCDAFDDSLIPSNFPPFTFWPGGDWEKNMICDVMLPVKIK